MSSEVIKLNLIPKGEMPVFHASQFDTGRLITCELYRGEDAYSVPEGYTVELHCRKVDNNIVTMASTLINDNVVTFTSTEQLTACNGNNLCEVAILDEGYRIGTLNFWLEVEIDPLKGGINSTSEIHNLENQIEEITTEIIGEDYYNKSEVDDLLADKADASSVYTKTETDTKLALKANAADVYTKSQTDILLSAKANSSDVYSKSQTDTLLAAKVGTFQLDSGIPLGDVFAAQVEQAFDSDIGFYDKVSNRTLDVYTKAQVDTALALKANAADVYTKAETDAKIEKAIEEIMPVDTAGPSAIASFTTGLALPLVDCKVGITATGGNGTPDNPNPINGYTEANITRCGVNLFDSSAFVDSYPTKYETTSDGSIQTISNNTTDDILWSNTKGVSGSISITFISKYENTGSVGIRPKILYTDGTTATIYPTNTQDYHTETFTTYNNKTVEKIVTDYGTFVNKTNFYMQVELSATPTEYHAYNGQTYTIAFGQTVYGGVLDVTRGKLKPCIEYPSYNGEALSGRWLSSEATYVEGTTPPTGSQVVSLDDYGSDIDLTPEVISAIVGVNNVYSDTNGDTTVKFKDTIQNYIDKKVST